MIPVLIGAAAVAAGAAIMSGDGGDIPKFEPVEKREVTEEYVMRQLNRAGKNFRTLKVSNERVEKLKNIVDIVGQLHFKRSTTTL